MSIASAGNDCREAQKNNFRTYGEAPTAIKGKIDLIGVVRSEISCWHG